MSEVLKRCKCGSPFEESERVEVPSPECLTVYGYRCSECGRVAIAVPEIRTGEFMDWVEAHFAKGAEPK